MKTAALLLGADVAAGPCFVCSSHEVGEATLVVGLRLHTAVGARRTASILGGLAGRMW